MGKKNLVIKDAEISSKAKIERAKYNAPEFLKLDDNSISLAKGERERLYYQNLCISILEYNLSSQFGFITVVKCNVTGLHRSANDALKNRCVCYVCMTLPIGGIHQHICHDR